MMELYGKTEKGPYREKNEDSFRYMELEGARYLAVVCDGMGGERGGEVASTLAVNKISENIMSNIRGNISSNSIKHLIKSSIIASNSLIKLKAKKNNELLGMGTTAVVCVISDGIVHIGHVGDSRAYLIEKTNILQITKDHTMVQFFWNRDKLLKKKQRNILIKT